MPRAALVRFALLACAWIALAPSPGARSRTPVVGTSAPVGFDGIVVRVVDETGALLPDAEVRFRFEDERDLLPDPDAPFRVRQGLRMAAPPPLSRVDRWLETSAAMRPGANGELRIDGPSGRALLVAGRAGSRWGFLWLPRDDGEATRVCNAPVQLELAPDWDLSVRVETGGRRLQRVPVGLRWSGGRMGGSGAWDDPEECVIEHAGYALRDAAGSAFVELTTLLDPPVRIELDAHRAPARPLVLDRPATGAVEVVQLDADAPGAQRGAVVELRFAGDEPPAHGRMDVEPPRRIRAPVIDGKARFDGVTLGRELELRVDGQDPPLRQRFRGPSAPDDVVREFLELSETERPVQKKHTPNGAQLPTGSLHGAVLLAPGVPVEQVTLLLRGENALLGPWERYAELANDGRFAFVDVPCGSARFEILPSAAQVLAPEARSIVFEAYWTVQPGENQDPRFACIDLRAKLFRHELVLDGVDPAQPFHARVFYARAWSRLAPDERFYAHDWELPLVLVSPWERIDLELFAPGYRAVELRDVGARVDVPLVPALPVRLRLHTDGALPAPPRVLKALLLPADAPDLGFDWEGPAFGPSRELVTRAWRPGRTKVVWVAGETHEGGGSFGGVEPEVSPQQFLEVFDTPLVQTFDVWISGAEVARLLRRL